MKENELHGGTERIRIKDGSTWTNPYGNIGAAAWRIAHSGEPGGQASKRDLRLLASVADDYVYLMTNIHGNNASCDIVRMIRNRAKDWKDEQK